MTPAAKAGQLRLLRHEAEDFLYREAELLDARRYVEWLALFTADGSYWVPMDENADPGREPSIQYDDRKLLEMRVHQLVNKPHYAQRPASRTLHAISNVTVAPAQRTDEALVRCITMITELREGDYLQLGLGEQRLFAARCEYRLRQAGSLAIASKKVVLINRDLPIVNLSFIL